MRIKLGTMLLAMLVAGVCVPALHAAVLTDADQVHRDDLGMKGATASDPAVPAVPASTQAGMLVMILLVLTASTYVFLNDSRFERRPVGPASSPTPPSPSTPSETPTRKRSGRGAHSPKNKSKRTFPHERHSHDQARKGWNIARRGAPHAGGRRRSGPGCRGVR